MRTPSVLKPLALANGLNSCSDFSQLYSYCCVPRESMEYCETTLIPVLAVWAWYTMRYSHGTSAITAGKFQSGRPRMRQFFRIFPKFIVLFLLCHIQVSPGCLPVAICINRSLVLVLLVPFVYIVPYCSRVIMSVPLFTHCPVITTTA